MPIDIKQILVLILVLVTMASIFSAISYIFFWLLLRIYRWLYKHSWFSNRVIQMQIAIRDFWKKYLPNLTNLWDFFYEVLADPIFYGYALVVVVNRLQSISEYVKQNPRYNFFQILELDMNTDTTFYMIFFIIFTLWMFGKVWKHNQDVKEKIAMRKVLEANTKSLKNVETGLSFKEQPDIGLINKEIRQALQMIKDK